MRKQSGFTMIELVMVIVVVAILAAVAWPKSADVGQAALKSGGQQGEMAGTNAWQGLVLTKSESNPGNPYPTLVEVKGQLNNGKYAAGNIGVCVAMQRLQRTYKDFAQTQPTTQASDVVQAISQRSEETTTAVCP